LALALLRSDRRYGKVWGVVGEQDQRPGRSAERAERRAARHAIGDYYQVQLRVLLERVREGFAGWDAGEIDRV
jgi:hypothetical protein